MTDLPAPAHPDQRNKPLLWQLLVQLFWQCPKSSQEALIHMIAGLYERKGQTLTP